MLEITFGAELKTFEKLPLFPRIWVPEEGHIVHCGFVLLPDQNTVVAAEQELRQSMKKLNIVMLATTSEPIADTLTGARTSQLSVFLLLTNPA